MLTMGSLFDGIGGFPISAIRNGITPIWASEIEAFPIEVMDIEAKHLQADENGVRIAELDEMSYRKSLWAHRPLTDFWRVGSGYAKKLEANGMFTMGDVARRSVTDEGSLYKLFGINAELLIDHAWGWEPCTIAEIKAYKPSTNSISSGQVLHCPYSFDKAKLITREMADMLALDLVDKGLMTDQIVLTIGFDIENLKDPAIRKQYHGAVTTDYYGREVPKHAHGTSTLGRHTSSTKRIMEATSELFDRIVDRNLLIRRINVTANHVIDEAAVSNEPEIEQLNLFTDYEAEEAKRKAETAELERERKMQLTTQMRFPDMVHVGDITKLDGATLPPVDIICGGSPCQDLSVAGARAGLAGARSGLFMEQCRIVKEMRDADGRNGRAALFVRPRFMVWENVPGAFSSGESKGEDFRIVLEEIVRIKAPSIHVPRPDSGRWESAGRILLGDVFSLA